MAHFAKLDENNVVIAVNAVANDLLLDETGQENESLGIEFLKQWSSGYEMWKQTSYHANFRKNFAGIGYTYDAQRDAFIPPKPFASWVLDEDTCLWNAPLPMPTDGQVYMWNEENLAWDQA